MTDRRRPRRSGGYESGFLINRSGERRYHKQGDIEHVLRYVLRQREDETRENELAFWGAYGLPEWEDAEGLSDAVRFLQKAHTRRGKFGRYVDHEIYNFAPMEISGLERQGEKPIERAARKMAEDIYREGFPVVFAGHRKATDYLETVMPEYEGPYICWIGGEERWFRYVYEMAEYLRKAG